MFGLNNFLNETAHAIGGTDTELFSYPMGCQAKDEEVPVTSRDVAMLVFLLAMGLLISLYQIYIQQYLEDPFINNFLALSSPDGPLSKPALTVIWNAMDSVDTFFLIGSILLSYLTLKEFEKNGGLPGHYSLSQHPS